MAEKLSENTPAPAFSLPATYNDGKQADISLSDYAGKWLVLYFYPKDNTPGCTTQACDFRDVHADLPAEVLGVSADDAASHEKFIGEHQLSFPLLIDEGHQLAQHYGAYGERNLYGKKVTGVIRSTFIISPEGMLAKVMYNVKATGHVGRVQKALEQLQS